MQHWINKAHIAAQTHANALKYGIAVAIILGGLLYRNPTLACTLLLSTAICLYVLATTGKKLRLEAGSMAAVAAASLTLTMLLSPDVAHAAGGIAGWARAIKAQLGDVYDLLIYGSYGGGMVGLITSVVNGKKKSNGDQSIKTASIYGNGIGGVALMMLGYLADSLAESVGGSSGQMNRMPGGL
ncbi:conserved membrane hypothetical protein [Cupriavidus taiwanensis]|uniref:hypothetical protein n=1 Tax=Cupriavidus taiwanensis TaxID=164546 RepID=UPI000E1B1871|nr:hypothetical protein [Cupriavidus taiwanensis]SPA23679.1 conserved membrane hypothetical protein [Cupriavidus taiwanensis]